MIPLVNLPLQHQEIEDELADVVQRIVRSGNYILGPYNEAFQNSFSAYCGAAHAVAVSSGTAALHLALLAAGISPGDEVITVPMTFVATVAAIQYVGAVAKLVDIDPDTWTMDCRLLELAITPRSKAVVPVHLHGRLADMQSIAAIARAHNLVVIEDAAQAHGAERDGRRAGTFGDLGCFSFYPAKNLGACGEGGAVVTDNAEYAERVRLMRHWGQKDRYLHLLKGFNYRMDEIQAAVLSIKLRYVDTWTKARRQLAEDYHRKIDNTGIATPARCAGLDHVYHVYAVRVAQRPVVSSYLAAEGVQTGIHYPVPVHLQPAYADLGYSEGDFPVAEQLAKETLSLPLFPGMSCKQVREVSEALIRVAGQQRVGHAAALG